MKGKLCDSNAHSVHFSLSGKGSLWKEGAEKMRRHCRDNNIYTLYVVHPMWLVAFCQGPLLAKWLLNTFYSHTSVLHQP